MVENLFGDMVCATPRKRGRPPFERTQENANKVSMMLAMGWCNERIAAVILDPRTGKPISLPTLKRYFRAELQARDHARDRFNLRRMMVVWAEADKGNMAAQRQLDRMFEMNDRALAEARVKSRLDHDAHGADAAPPRLLGKKEQRSAEARDAEARLALEVEEEARAARPH